MFLQRITRFLILVLICSLPLWLDSCQQTKDEPASSSIQGNWKITAIGVNPAYKGVVFDFAATLKGQGETCLTDAILSFKADGNVTYDNPATCANAATSKEILDSLFGNAKYTETDTEVTISDATSGAALVTKKTISGNTVNLVWTATTDIDGNPPATTYTVTMVRV
jgi:hypothetical protein